MPIVKKDSQILTDTLNNSSKINNTSENNALISFIQKNVNSPKHFKDNCEFLPSNSLKDDEKGGILGPESQCRICLITNTSKQKIMISPCRCSGTMKFVHTSCLTVNLL